MPKAAKVQRFVELCSITILSALSKTRRSVDSSPLLCMRVCTKRAWGGGRCNSTTKKKGEKNSIRIYYSDVCRLPNRPGGALQTVVDMHGQTCSHSWEALFQPPLRRSTNAPADIGRTQRQIQKANKRNRSKPREHARLTKCCPSFNKKVSFKKRWISPPLPHSLPSGIPPLPHFPNDNIISTKKSRLR